MRFLPLIVAFGCATVAGRDDYADYRAVRLAEGDGDRREAIAAYLGAHPEGAWAGELRAEHAAAEEEVYHTHKGDAAGLRYYLRVYPEGRFAEQARARLAALEALRANRQREADTDRAVHRERREQTLEERRRWATNAVSFWTRILLTVTEWGKPIGEVAAAHREFDEAFRAAPPPRCNAIECIKYYELDFAVPVPGQTRIERQIRLLLRLRFDGEERELVRAEMLMPDRGFSRWFELANTEFLETADPEQRQHSIDWALERLIPWVRAQAPQARAVDVVPEPIDPPTVGALGQALETEIEGELVLPLALQGLRTEELEIVVFAAADDDTGAAYDGFFIRRIDPEAE